MASILGIIFSLVLFIPCFLCGADLLVLQNTHARLESLSVQVSYKISLAGEISEEIKEFVTLNNAEITCINNCTSAPIGDIITFKLYKTYKPLLISKETIEVAIKRTSMVGYY